MNVLRDAADDLRVRSRAAQGLDGVVTDAAALARIADLLDEENDEPDRDRRAS